MSFERSSNIGGINPLSDIVFKIILSLFVVLRVIHRAEVARGRSRGAAARAGALRPRHARGPGGTRASTALADPGADPRARADAGTGAGFAAFGLVSEQLNKNKY